MMLYLMCGLTQEYLHFIAHYSFSVGCFFFSSLSLVVEFSNTGNLLVGIWDQRGLWSQIHLCENRAPLIGGFLSPTCPVRQCAYLIGSILCYKLRMEGVKERSRPPLPCLRSLSQ